MNEWMLSVAREVEDERKRAHRKHGTTSAESQSAFADRRVTIITEELGECSRVLNDRHHALADRAPITRTFDAELRAEVVQLAAMAVSWLAAIDGQALR